SLLGTVITPHPERAELDAAAATIAYRKLVELGHRRFAFVTRGESHTALGTARYRALCGVLEARRPDAPVPLFVAIDDPASCCAEMQRLAAQPDAPTAII